MVLTSDRQHQRSIRRPVKHVPKHRADPASCRPPTSPAPVRQWRQRGFSVDSQPLPYGLQPRDARRRNLSLGGGTQLKQVVAPLLSMFHQLPDHLGRRLPVLVDVDYTQVSFMSRRSQTTPSCCSGNVLSPDWAIAAPLPMRPFTRQSVGVRERGRPARDSAPRSSPAAYRTRTGLWAHSW